MSAEVSRLVDLVSYQAGAVLSGIVHAPGVDARLLGELLARGVEAIPYTSYYAGIALLPGVAGWRQDALGGDAAIESAAAAIFPALASYFQVSAARGTASETPERARPRSDEATRARPAVIPARLRC